jgi:hypothetical protein
MGIKYEWLAPILLLVLVFENKKDDDRSKGIICQRIDMELAVMRVGGEKETREVVLVKNAIRKDMVKSAEKEVVVMSVVAQTGREEVVCHQPR